RLQRLGPAVGVEHPLGRRPGGQLGQPLGQVDLRLVVEVGAGHVDQPGRLVLDGGDDFRVAVAGGGHGDAGGEVEEQVAVHVVDDLEDVDAREGDAAAVDADAGALPLDGGAVAGDEDGPLGEADRVEGGGDRLPELAEAAVPLAGRGADGVVADGVRGERRQP